MIVWLISYPRSGNTLLRTLLYHHCGVHTYSMSADPEFFRQGFYNDVGHMGWPPYGNDDSGIMKLMDSPITYFIKTHAGNKEGVYHHGKIVHIVRDGRDAVVSQCRRRVQRVPTRKYPEELWDRVAHPYWQSFVLTWLDEADINVRYEDMIHDGIGVVRHVVQGLGLCLPVFEGAEVPTFDDLSSKCDTFFRKGSEGTHKNEMSDEFERVFMDHNGEGMKAYGYC
jgi:hypothetical protein